MNFVPERTALGELTLLDTLIYYDGPQLFTCSNQDNDLFLAIAVDESDVSKTWLYAKVTPEIIAGLDELSAVSIRQAILATIDPHVWILEESSISPGRILSKLSKDSIPGDYLPATPR